MKRRLKKLKTYTLKNILFISNCYESRSKCSYHKKEMEICDIRQVLTTNMLVIIFFSIKYIKSICTP